MRSHFSGFLVLSFAVLFACIGCGGKKGVDAPQIPNYSGKWMGLASDDRQLGTGGLSVFTFQLSQDGTTVSGQVIVQKAAFADTYTGTLNGKMAVENGGWVFSGSFDVVINNNRVHVTFSCVRYLDQLVGDFGGTNSLYGTITGGSFVLDKK